MDTNMIRPFSLLWQKGIHDSCMIVLWSETHTLQWHENWSNDNFFYEPDLGENNGEEYGTGLKTSRTTFQRISRSRREESRAEKLIKRPTTLRGTDRKYPWCGFQWSKVPQQLGLSWCILLEKFPFSFFSFQLPTFLPAHQVKFVSAYRRCIVNYGG